MKKFICSVVALFGGIVMAYGQLTEGVPTARQVKTGNRASAGDFGLYMGATYWFEGMKDWNF